VSRVIYHGNIYGDFEGYDENKLFKMDNGTYWIQAQYHYWYHYEYRPTATISEENGQYILTVAGESIQVSPISGVIESRIEGEFTGWDGESKYELVNGQVWEQATYKYVYKYAYRPEAIIYRSGGSYTMEVKGTKAKVQSIR